MPNLDINIDALVKYSAKLDKMGRWALPVAVKQTLNSAAFDLKQKEMPKEAERDFTNRTKTFFKYNSGVDMARGFMVNGMRAAVGFESNKLKLGANRNFSVKDLEQQEYGGDINRKELIPLAGIRKGGTYAGNVIAQYRLSNLKAKPSEMIDSRKGVGGKSAFRAAQYKALKTGQLIIGNRKTSKGNYIVFKVDSLSSSLKDKKFTPKMKALYSYREGRKVGVKPMAFMRTASFRSANKLESFYVKHAMAQIERYMK